MRGLLVGLIAAATFAGAAHANTITVAGGGTLTCTLSCQAFTGAGGGGAGPTGPGVLSSVAATAYDGTPSSEGDEAARLNLLTGTTSFTSANATRIAGGGGSLTFTTLAEFIVLKLGQDAIFVKNTSGGALQIAYASAQARGLSHYTEFGAASVVPLPGAAWLMIAGIAGLIGAQHRKRETA